MNFQRLSRNCESTEKDLFFLNVSSFAGYEILDLVRRSGSTKQKSDLMMTLAQVPPVGGESPVGEIDGK